MSLLWYLTHEISLNVSTRTEHLSFFWRYNRTESKVVNTKLKNEGEDQELRGPSIFLFSGGTTERSQGCEYKVKKRRRRSGTNTLKSHILLSKPKLKEAHTKLYKRSRKTSIKNRMNSSFPNGWSFRDPK